MPDTYTSQFSGEEIDSALRAAQMISGASTPAELREKLEIRGDTIPVSATDPTPVSEALTASGGGINPNLLDNWYFRKPVNQRNGWYAPAGLTYWKEDGTTVGPIPKPYPVTRWDGTPGDSTAHFLIDGTSYKFDGSKAVFGYCTVGYTVDRWYSALSTKTVQVANDHLAISDTGDYGGFFQRLEYESLLGKTVTFSVLAKRTAAGAQVPYITVMIGSSKFEGWGEIVQSDDYQLSSCTVTLSAAAPSEGYFFVDIVGMAGSSIDIKAAKLELGDTQTLAHKENGVWVLNEVPDFGEQLARCRRHHREIERSNYGTFAFGMSTSATEIDFLIPLNPPMRVAPSFSFEGSFATNGVSFTSVSSLGVVKSYPDGIMLRATGSGFVRGEERTLQTSSEATSKIIISADL